jgi:heptosyltransferase I
MPSEPEGGGAPPGNDQGTAPAGPTIILVRLGARGDVVFASPLVGAIRRRHPGARIVWVVEPAAADLIRHHPLLDRVVVWPRGLWAGALKGGRLPTLTREVREFAATLREERAELAVDLHGLLRSAAVARLTGAREVVGLGAREGSALLVDRVIPRDGGDTTRISSEYLHLASELGWDTDDFHCEVHPGPAHRAGADAHRARLGLSQPYAVLAPFTTRPQKHWREERWAPLALRIREEVGLRPVLLGGPDDREAAGRIAAAAALVPPRHFGVGPLVDLVGDTSLGEAAALVQGASLVVGVDTGLTHLGVAMDRPVVALFGSTLPYTHAPGRRVRVLHEPLDCSPCRTRPTCGGAFTCMAMLDVDRVAQAALGVVRGGRGFV